MKLFDAYRVNVIAEYINVLEDVASDIITMRMAKINLNINYFVSLPFK